MHTSNHTHKEGATPSFPFTLNQRYRVEKLFADSGGMGVIYEAADLRCANNRVLIKTTRYDSGKDAKHFRYTQDEALSHVINARKILEWEKKILVRFRDDGLNNIPNPNNFFYDQSITLKAQHTGIQGEFSLPQDILQSEPFLVMERIQGKPLEEVMRDRSWRQHLELYLLKMMREILTIWIKMHRKFDLNGQDAYFIYQDLKPANILVSHNDFFTLIDFGATTLKLGSKTTEPTAGCITTGYAAPEAQNGHEAHIDHRFDLYTLGATAWHVITGQDPRNLGQDFPRLDPTLLQKHNISQALTHIITKSLASDPNQRYQHAAAMRKDVMQLLHT